MHLPSIVLSAAVPPTYRDRKRKIDKTANVSFMVYDSKILRIYSPRRYEEHEEECDKKLRVLRGFVVSILFYFN